MTKIIRFWGVVAFMVLIGLLISTWIIFSDIWVKKAIEISIGTALNTSVNIDEADLSLSPISIELNNLQVADRTSTDQNRYEISSVLFDIDASELLRRKIIINSADIKNIRFHTERNKSSDGELTRQRNRFTLPTINIPDVKEIIKSADIKSPEMARKFSSEMSEKVNQLKNDLSNLPGQSELQLHRKKAENLIEQIKTGGITTILTKSSEINNLSRDINTDIIEIDRIYTETGNLIRDIKNNREILQNQIHSDISRVGKKYSEIENLALSISSMIFSDKVQSQINQALFWYKKFEPFINKAVKRFKNGLELINKEDDHGLYIRFQEKNPKPDFYIKSASISMYHSLGYLTGQIIEFTSDQSISGRPTTLKIGGNSLERADQVELTGIFNRTSAETIADTVEMSISGLNISEFKSQLSEDLSLSLTNANADIKGNIINNRGNLSGSIEVKFLDTRWYVESVDKAKMISELQSILDQISSFQLKINISGDMDSTIIQISSDLDSVLGEIFMERINTTLVKFEKEFQKEIEIKLNEWDSESESNITKLDKIQSELLFQIRDHRDVLKQIVF